MSDAAKATRAYMVELCTPTFLIGVALAFLWDSQKITAQSFDSLGPAPIPRLICWCVILLCLTVIGQTLFAARVRRMAIPGRHPEAKVEPKPEARTAGILPVPEPEPEAPPPQPLLALATLGLTVAYVAAMVYRIASFAIVTTVFLLLTIGLLARFQKRSLIVALIIALFMGFGCQYLFTEIFVIDLPTGAD